MHEIEELLKGITDNPKDRWYDLLATIVATWPASVARERFIEVCHLVDVTLEPSSQYGIAAHLLRQQLFSVDVRLATLKQRTISTNEIESDWAKEWGDIRPWNENPKTE